MGYTGMTGGQLYAYLCDHQALMLVFKAAVFGVVGGVVWFFAYLGRNELKTNGEMMKEKTKIILAFIFTGVMFSVIIGVGVWAEHDVQYSIKNGLFIHGKDIPK
jgi:hypothetical protein